MRQRAIGNVLVLFGLVVISLGVMTNQARATDQGPNYQDKLTSISGSRSYDGTNTTFTFTANFSETVSHIVVSSCPEGTNVVSATGPSGVTVEKNKTDPPTGHTGAKFEPGRSGTYTVVFSGNVSGAEFIVKNGNGHKHYSIGSGCAAVSTVSTSTTSSTTSTTAPPTTTTTEPPTTSTSSTSTSSTTTTTSLLADILGETTTTSSTTSSSTSSTTAQQGATTSSTADPSVLGSQLEKPAEPLLPAPTVEGATETQDADIPSTGSNTGDYLLLAGLAFVLGGLAVRFGQAEEPTAV